MKDPQSRTRNAGRSRIQGSGEDDEIGLRKLFVSYPKIYLTLGRQLDYYFPKKKVF
jgi:hypothetical protein